MTWINELGRDGEELGCDMPDPRDAIISRMDRELAALRSALRDRDERLGRVAHYETITSDDDTEEDFCACCGASEQEPHLDICPLAGWEPYHE